MDIEDTVLSNTEAGEIIDFDLDMPKVPMPYPHKTSILRTTPLNVGALLDLSSIPDYEDTPKDLHDQLYTFFELHRYVSFGYDKLNENSCEPRSLRYYKAENIDSISSDFGSVIYHMERTALRDFLVEHAHHFSSLKESTNFEKDKKAYLQNVTKEISKRTSRWKEQYKALKETYEMNAKKYDLLSHDELQRGKYTNEVSFETLYNQNGQNLTTMINDLNALKTTIGEVEDEKQKIQLLTILSKSLEFSNDFENFLKPLNDTTVLLPNIPQGIYIDLRRKVLETTSVLTTGNTDQYVAATPSDDVTSKSNGEATSESPQDQSIRYISTPRDKQQDLMSAVVSQSDTKKGVPTEALSGGLNTNRTTVQTNALFTDAQQQDITTNVTNLNEKVKLIKTLLKESDNIESDSFADAFKKLISMWSELGEEKQKSVSFSDFSDIFQRLFTSLNESYTSPENLENKEKATYGPLFAESIKNAKSDIDSLLTSYEEEIKFLEENKTKEQGMWLQSAFLGVTERATALETKLDQLSSKIRATSLTEQYSVVLKLASGKNALNARNQNAVSIDNPSEFAKFKTEWSDLQRAMKGTEEITPIAPGESQPSFLSATFGLVRNAFNALVGTTTLEESEKKTLLALLTAITEHKELITKKIEDETSQTYIDWLKNFVSAYSTLDKQYILSNREIFKEFLDITKDSNYAPGDKWEEGKSKCKLKFEVRIETIRTQFDLGVSTIEKKIEELQKFLDASFKNEKEKDNDHVRFFGMCEEIIKVFENVLNNASEVRVLSFYKNFITQSPTQAQAETPEFSDDRYRTRYEDFKANILVQFDAKILALDEAKLKEEVKQLKDNANDIAELQIRLSQEEEEEKSASETDEGMKVVLRQKDELRKKESEEVTRLKDIVSKRTQQESEAFTYSRRNTLRRAKEKATENYNAANKKFLEVESEIEKLQDQAEQATEALHLAKQQVKLTKDHITYIQNSMKSDFDEKATEIILEKYKTYLLEATIQLQKVRATEALSGEQDKVAEKSTAAPPTTDAVQKAKEDAKAAQRAKQEKERLSDLVTSLQTQRNELEKEKEIFEAATKNIGKSIEELGAYEGELQSIYTEVITLVNNLKALSTEIKNCEEETQKEYNVAMTDGMITREQDCVKKLKECQTKIEEFRIMQPKINMAVEAMEPSIQKIGKYINDLQNIKNEVTASSSMPNEVKNFLDSLLEEQNKRKTLLSEVQKIGTTARKEVDSFKENSNFILLNLKENLQLEYNGFLAAIESYKLKKSAEEAQAAAEVAKEAMEAADATEKEKLKTEAEELKTIAAEKAQVAEAASKAAAEARRVKVVPRRGSSPSILSSLTTVNTFSKNEDNYHTLLTMDLSSQVSVDVKALNFGKSLYYQIPVMTQLIRFLHHLWRFKTYVNNDKINEDKIFQEIENDAKVFVQNLMDSPDSISMLAPLPPLDAKKSISGDNLRSCKRLLLNFKDTHIDEGLGKLVENGLLRESVVGWYMTTKHETFILGVILEELLTS